MGYVGIVSQGGCCNDVVPCKRKKAEGGRDIIEPVLLMRKEGAGGVDSLHPPSLSERWPAPTECPPT